ncbi:MAG: sortase [Anaerolineales bacterium]
MKSLKNILLISFILVAITFVQFGTPQTVYAACSGVVYVSSTGSGAGGCSWAAAFPNLQDAIALAASGDQIWVRAGTYYPDQGAGQINNSRDSTFNLKSGVAIYGGFAGTETLLSQRNVSANVTILSGDIDQVADNANNAYHVVSGDSLTSSSVLDGFTITNGNANGGDNYGGGMYLTSASPTLANLIFTANVGGNGGGLAGFASSSPTLTDVTFSSNAVTIHGGGIYLQDASDPILLRVTFSGNTSVGYGGGIAMFLSSPSLTDVTFDANRTTGTTNPGGGMYTSDSAPVLNRVTFSNNRAEDAGGGGMYNYASPVRMTNVTFYNNYANRRGGAIANETSSPILNNVTITGNSSTVQASGGMANFTDSDPIVRNTIMWGDTPQEVVNSDATSVPQFIDSIVQGGCPAGSTCTNVLSATAPFTVPATLANNGGFTQTIAITSTSSARDAGNNATCAAIDQRGPSYPRARTVADACDMGAYEFGGVGTVAGSVTTTYGSTSVSLSASVTPNPGGGTIQFYINGNPVGAPASVNAGTGVATLTYNPSSLAVGTHTIRADFSGFGAYPAGSSNPNNNGVLTINPAPLTVTANNKSRVYGAANPVFDATITGFVNGETLGTSDVTGSPSCTTAATPASPVSGSPYAITCTVGTLASTNYTFNFVAGNLTVTHATLTVTANNKSRVYGVANPVFDATITGFVNGETLITSDVTGSPTCSTTATPTSPVSGSPYTITCVAGTLTSSDYTFTFATGNLTVTQAVLTITANNISKNYGDTVTFAGTEFTASGLVGTDSVTSVTLTSAGAASTASVAGSPYTIVPSVAVGTGLANYTITYANGSLTVNTVALTVTANNKSRAYGAANPTLDATITGFVNGETLPTSGVTGAPSCTTAATPTSPVSGSPYAITCTVGTLAATNYTFNFVAGNLTITQATLTITANDISKNYGSIVIFAGTEFTTSGLVGTDTVTSVTLTSAGSAAAATVAGSPYPIVPSAALGIGLGNYTINYVNGSLTVNPVALTITANNISKNYGTTVTFTGTEFTTSGLVGSDTVTSVTLTSAGAASTATVAGSPYTIVPSAAIGTGLSNYSITYTNGSLTVNPIALSITANNLSKNYGTTVTFAGTEFSTVGLVGTDTVTSVTLTSAGAAATATVAGSPYPIIPSAAVGTGLGNYTITYNNGSLTVNTATLTITADNISKNYGDVVIFAGTEFTTTGLVGTDTVTSVTLTSAGTAAAATVAGSPYAIVPSAAIGTGLSNYTISYVNGSLTVNPITLTITANNISKNYGATVTFAGSEFTTSGLIGTDTVASVTLTSAGAAATATVAGSPYAIVPSAATGTGLGNYTINYVNGTLTVNSLTLTITANNISKNYGATVTFAGTEFTTSGLIGSDTVTSVTLTSAGAASTATVAGSPYAIVPSAATGTGLGNYTINYVDGTLTVNPVTLTITANNISKNYGATITFAGTEFTTSGLIGSDTVTSVTLTSAGAAATATVAGSPYAIVPSAAVGTGLGNYTITYTNGTLTVNPITLTITANSISKNYGDTVTFAGTEFTTSGLIGTDSVTSVTLTSAGAAATATVAGSPYTIVPSAALGTGLGNYTIIYANGTLTVNPLALTITANSISKNYGDTVTFTGTEFTTSGLIGTDTVASVTLTSAGAAANATVAGSPYTIVPSAALGTGLGNYTITYTNGVLTVNGLTVTPSITANDKVYDGTNAATFTCALTGVVPGDLVTCSGTATFANKNVGNNKTVTATGLTLGGANSGNYTLSTTTATDTANITALAITVTAVTDTKVYDGTTSSTGVPTTSIALATGDTATWTQTFNTKHVGTNKTLTPAGTINDGNGGNNYTVTFVNNTTGVITTRAITVTAVTDTKPFDGNTSSAGVPTITTGSLGTGDTATWTQTFDTPLVGTGKTLNPAGTVNDGNSGNNYAVTFVPDNTGSITGTPLGVMIDQAGSQSDPTNASPINFTVVFTAPVSNFATGDVSFTGSTVGGTLVGTVTGSGTTYTVAVTGMTGNGTVVASIPAAVASDGSGNVNNTSSSTDNTVTYDGTAPAVTIEQAIGQVDPTNTSPINFTVTFSEPVSNFATGDVSFTGNTVGGPLVGTVTNTGPTTYNVAVTGMTGTGIVVTSINAGVANDTAGNGNSASTSVDNTVTFDVIGPTVTINQAVGQADPTNASPINFTVTFSEAVSNFATGDVSFTGSTVGGALVGTVSGGPTIYNVAVTGMTGTGTVIASIPAGAATDTLGNDNAASTSTDHTVTFDGTGPTVTINQAGGQADPTGASPINFTVVFSELVSNFATGDVDLSGSTAPGALVGTVTGSGTTYTVTVSGMTGSGTVVAFIGTGVASDALGNGNAASTSTDNTVTYDTTAPGVTIDQAGTQVDPTNTSPINFTVTFTEAVSGFTAGDVSFTSSAAPGTLVGTVTNTGPATYNVAVTGMTGNGTVVASIAAGVATDTSGNGNTASSSIDNTVTYDNTRPIVAIGTPVPTTTVTGPADFAVTVTGATTINLTNADVTLNTTGTATAATITVTNGGTANPTVTLSGITGNGTITITIAAGVASDGSGNTSLAVTSTTPLLVDNAGPVVLFNANTVPGDNATVAGGPTQLKVAFSENVRNDSSAGAANNIANYLLVTSGPNTLLDTISCLGGVQADDVQYTINTASYSSAGGKFVATLAVNGGTPLPVGTYHLFVCGTTSIEDLTNNELNNGAADTVIDFTVVQATAVVPKTGFAVNTVTSLPIQPEGLAYTSTDMWLEIPSLNVKMPIVGVPKTSAGWDVTWLDKDAGWLDGTAYPTWKGNSVITAHVWDALNQPGPFTRLKDLKYGDQVKVHAFGQVFIYEIRETTTISPTNATAMLKHQDKSWLTLVTCEGFQENTKDYSSRRMVRAVLVSVAAEK